MSAKLVIEKKVRWVLALIVIMILAVPILAVRSYLGSLDTDSVHTAMATDERLVAIDGRSMLVQPNTLGSTMREWLKSRKDHSLSFEFSDRSFVPGTAVPNPITVVRINQVAGLATENPALMVQLLLPSAPLNETARQLDRQRAARVRSALIARGVDASHVTVEVDDQDLPTTQTARIAVLLSK